MLAGKVFALFERVPALRLVIAHLRRNPAINPAERHRIEDEALDRRHDRERRQIERRATALDKIEAQERRGLIRDLLRETRVEDRMRQAESAQRRRVIRETADDITAEKPDRDQRSAADERRARLQERLAEARHKPAGPRRGGPGWE